MKQSGVEEVCWTTEHTHTEMKHINANSILSVLIYASLETIVALAVLLIGLMNH